ncbi:FtsB family cell division protein [Nocardioides montaniterrae]
MADPRRSTRKPGRPSTGRTSPAAAARSAEAAARRVRQRGELQARAKAAAAEKQRTRITSRAVVLVAVLAVLAMSYASSLRAYLQQRGDIDHLTSQIAASNADNAEKQREIERWKDPAYVEQQAKLRGYVMRGETPYVVVDNGRPLDGSSRLSDPASVKHPARPTWYATAWESMQIAGNPPTKVTAPADTIDPSKRGKTQ